MTEKKKYLLTMTDRYHELLKGFATDAKLNPGEMVDSLVDNFLSRFNFLRQDLGYTPKQHDKYIVQFLLKHENDGFPPPELMKKCKEYIKEKEEEQGK